MWRHAAIPPILPPTSLPPCAQVLMDHGGEGMNYADISNSVPFNRSFSCTLDRDAQCKAFALRRRCAMDSIRQR